MLAIKDKTIAEIVSEDISTASVFKKYNLDFCCGGGITVEKACEKAQIDVDSVVHDLMNNHSGNDTPQLNFKDWKIDFLMDYIENVHHTYVRENIPMINQFAQKVASVHGEHSPETVEIASLFKDLSEELQSHLVKEEEILFPSLKAKVKDPEFSLKEDVIAMLEDEHDHAGDLIKSIQQLSNNFVAPDWACNTYKALYHKLDEFTSDLFQHIHLENNILFTKARLM